MAKIKKGSKKKAKKIKVKKPNKKAKLKANKLFYFDISFKHKEGVPLIYDFLMNVFPAFCTKQKIKNLDLYIERLEPLSPEYSNLSVETQSLQDILKRFAKTHSLKIEPLGKKNKVLIKANLSPKQLAKILIDYNKIFDIFFTDTRIESKKITIDVMDFILNSALVYGNLDVLIKLTEVLVKEGLLDSLKDVSHLEE